MSVFGPSDAPCGVFSPSLCGGGTQAQLTFVRSTSTQNSAGEILLSFSTVGTWSLDLQPQPAGIQRLVHGIVKEVEYLAFIPGNPDIRELDRCYVCGSQMEVTQAAHYGFEHVEISLTHIGR
jgi:hypothetical protein